MKVLHVTPTYVPAWRYGGPIRSVHGLCAALVRQGVDVDVFTTSVDGPDEVPVPPGGVATLDGVKVHYFGAGWLRRLYHSAPMARALSDGVPHYDLVHLHSVFLWPTWAAAREASKHGVPYVVSPRGMLVKELVRRKSTVVKTAWIALVERRNLEQAAAVHVTSTAEASELERFGFRLPPVVVLPNGVDRSSAWTQPVPEAAERLLSGARPVILYLGRLSWKKGLDRLLRAVAGVPEASLLVAGNDDENYSRTLAPLVAELRLEDRVAFCGAVDGGAKGELYRRASLLALTSYSENFGNVVLEAMAEGCPVLVTPEVGAAPIVAGAGAGLVVDGRPEAIAAGIRELLSSAERRAAFGRAGRACVEAGYSWDSIALRMRDEYRSIAARSGRRAACRGAPGA